MNEKSSIKDLGLELYKLTSGFQQHRYWNQIIKFEELELEAICEELVSNIFNPNQTPPSMSIFVDGGIRPWLSGSIQDTGFSNNTSLDKWFSNWLNGKEYFVIMDHLHNYSETLHRLIKDIFIEPLVLNNNGFCLGVSCYGVFGNYGFTPFGIHTDEHPVILIHFGPDEKDLWVWEKDPNNSIVGKQQILTKSSEWTKGATHYRMKAGDITLIPSKMYHLLNTDGFSVTMGISIFSNVSSSISSTLPKARFENKILWNEETNFENEIIKTLETYFGVKFHEIPNKLVRDIVDANLRLKSNGYLVGTPTKRDEDFITSNKKFSLTFPSAIFVQERGADLDIYIRGRKLKINNRHEVKEIFNFINSLVEFSLDDLVAMSKCNNKLSEQILHLIWEFKGITLSKK